MKIFSGAIAAVLLSLTMTTSAFGSVPFEQTNLVQQECQKGVRHKCSHEFEAFIKESLKKHNGDLAKVKEDVAKHVVEKRALLETQLAETAKKKGITVEELKAQIVSKRQEKFERKAKEKGISTEQLKEKMHQRREQKMEEMAKNLGITREQLKQILPEHPMSPR